MDVGDIFITIFDFLTILGFLLTIILVFLAFKVIKKKVEWHIHFRSIICLGFFSLCASSLLTFVIGMINFHFKNNVYENSSDEWEAAYKKIYVFALYFNHFYRYVQWSICLERLVATVKVRMYEKFVVRNFWLLVLIIIGIVSYVTLQIMYWTNMVKKRHFIFIFLDIPIYITFTILWYTNRKMSKNQEFIVKTLSQKYQVRENLFIFWLYIPMITIYMIQQMIFHLFALKFQSSESSDKYFIILYAGRIFILLSNIIPIIFVKSLYNWYLKLKKNSNQISDTDKDDRPKINSIKVGEAYFNMLQNAWNS
uniref:G_PROTEIN_RECEP_F1_2 domain-containing protein n=1 Tax=Strongyloides venezuelensis TaxID=75913 RepID=A0A0K0FCB8_STRVS